MEIKTENNDEISVEMKMKNETNVVSESNSFEQENICSSLSTNNQTEENLKPKEEIKSPNAKRTVKRINASVIKPVKKAKSRVNAFLS